MAEDQDSNVSLTAAGGLQVTQDADIENAGAPQPGDAGVSESLNGDADVTADAGFTNEMAAAADPTGLVDEATPDPVTQRTIERAVRYPGETVASTLLYIGWLMNEYKRLTAAIERHLRSGAVASQPELHAFLAQISTRGGEFVHAVESLEGGLSDDLRGAIVEGVSEFSKPQAA